jgi:Protein of unknown function (DUF1236)
MRSKLLIGTAALLAGVGLATAQNMPGGGQSAPTQHQGAQSPGAQGGAAGQDRERGRAGQAQQGTQGQSKQGQTTGQAPQREQGKEHRGAQQEKEKAQPQRSGAQQEKDKAQPQRSQRERDQTTGQSPSQTQPGAQTPQRQQGQQGQQGQPPQGQMQRGQQAQPLQGQAQQGQAGQTSGGVTLTTEQRTQVRQTILAGSNVPRASNVNFALRVGTTVPTSVHVVEVPTVLVNIHSEWRGFFYFVVGDEIIIVDRNHRIVAVIAV